MEEKKNNKNVIKIIGIITTIIGAVLLISGILIPKVSMGSDGWFEAESTKSSLTMFGIFLSMSGAITTTISGKVKNVTDLQRKITNSVVVVDDKITLKKEVVNNVTCKYCNSVYKETENKCPNCGAPKSK